MGSLHPQFVLVRTSAKRSCSSLSEKPSTTHPSSHGCSHRKGFCWKLMLLLFLLWNCVLTLLGCYHINQTCLFSFCSHKLLIVVHFRDPNITAPVTHSLSIHSLILQASPSLRAFSHSYIHFCLFHLEQPITHSITNHLLQ